MGSRTVSFGFTPGENEQLETVIKVPEERRSIIHGFVKSHCNKPIKDAIVKLFECINHNGEQILKPLTHTFTDECGQFAFGPLFPCRDYVIKVWVNDVKIRELVIHPDDCECQKDEHKYDEHRYEGTVSAYEIKQNFQSEAQTQSNSRKIYFPHKDDPDDLDVLDE